MTQSDCWQNWLATARGPVHGAVLPRDPNQTLRVIFDTPTGLPVGAWVVLRRGNEWFDRRFLNDSLGLAGQAGVELVVEPATLLESLVTAGERQHVEFKEKIPSSEEGSSV
jgi:hypothetical protein